MRPIHVGNAALKFNDRYQSFISSMSIDEAHKLKDVLAQKPQDTEVQSEFENSLFSHGRLGDPRFSSTNVLTWLGDQFIPARSMASRACNVSNALG